VTDASDLGLERALRSEITGTDALAFQVRKCDLGTRRNLPKTSSSLWLTNIGTQFFQFLSYTVQETHQHPGALSTLLAVTVGDF
jgi:hypothetical protein